MRSNLNEIHIIVGSKKNGKGQPAIISYSQIFIVDYMIGNFKGIKGIVKKYSLEWVLQYFISLIKQSSQVENSQQLFINNINNKSMMEIIDLLHERTSTGVKAINVLINKKKGFGEDCINVFNYISLNGIITSVKEMYGMRWEIKNQISEVLVHYEIPSCLLWLNIFETFVYSNSLGKLLHKLKPKKVIMNSDVHKLNRLIVMRCKEKDISTIVIQHGSTNLEYGFLPVLADRILVWGKISKNWFIQNGTPKDKIVVAGYPKKLQEIRTKSSHLIAGGIYLIALNPIGNDAIRYMLRESLVAFKKMNIKKQIVVKLHPSSNNYEKMVKEIVIGFDLDVKIIHQGDVILYIRQAKAVITTTSTVGLEAILLNVPLIQFKMEGILEMPYEDYGCSHVFKNHNELNLVISNHNKLISRLKNYPDFIADYFERKGEESLNFIQNYISLN